VPVARRSIPGGPAYPAARSEVCAPSGEVSVTAAENGDVSAM
jgi:hypothetical protein